MFTLLLKYYPCYAGVTNHETIQLILYSNIFYLLCSSRLTFVSLTHFDNISCLFYLIRLTSFSGCLFLQQHCYPLSFEYFSFVLGNFVNLPVSHASTIGLHFTFVRQITFGKIVISFFFYISFFFRFLFFFAFFFLAGGNRNPRNIYTLLRIAFYISWFYFNVFSYVMYMHSGTSIFIISFRTSQINTFCFIYLYMVYLLTYILFLVNLGSILILQAQFCQQIEGGLNISLNSSVTGKYFKAHYKQLRSYRNAFYYSYSDFFLCLCV